MEHENIRPAGTFLGYPSEIVGRYKAEPSSNPAEGDGVDAARTAAGYPTDAPEAQAGSGRAYAVPWSVTAEDESRPTPSDPLSQTRTLALTDHGEPSHDLGATNRFASVKPLGEGAMGEVTLVRDQDIDRPVAVKSLRTGLNHPAVMARFVDEIRTIGRLEHPNIAPIHDVGVDATGRPYFVMKYVEGEDLATIINKLRAGDSEYQERFTIERRMQIFLGVLQALEFAHSRGVLHRDVKPENIMVGSHGEVTLMDWGIARRFGEDAPSSPGSVEALDTRPLEQGAGTTRDGEIVGTPLYMSPEQARGDNSSLDERSDLYSAAVVFHELLTLDHYMSHAKNVEVLLRDIREVGWRNSLLAWHRSVQRPMPPMELYHYLRKGLQRDPARRYQSAREMLERLERLLEGKIPVQCHITLVKSTVRRLGRLVDRHPWLSFAGFAALTATAGVGLFNAVGELAFR